MCAVCDVGGCVLVCMSTTSAYLSVWSTHGCYLNIYILTPDGLWPDDFVRQSTVTLSQYFCSLKWKSSHMKVFLVFFCCAGEMQSVLMGSLKLSTHVI